ncbi:hypothetical protein EYC84_010225 [Monilinia fructicola]|uniref:Uncharacterized protein n=1 Tax=Monilinia fructicola TaxID=38448 RepID=A0A5M9JCU1_MONFR|nr:hypothetical protein EYC84_010225 [Monilinia fructicola]
MQRDMEKSEKPCINSIRFESSHWCFLYFICVIMRYLRSIIIFLILRRVFNIVSTHQGGKMGTLLHGVSQIDVISSIR